MFTKSKQPLLFCFCSSIPTKQLTFKRDATINYAGSMVRIESDPTKNENKYPQKMHESPEKRPF